jgi:iron complex transport system permease protein
VTRINAPSIASCRPLTRNTTRRTTRSIALGLACLAASAFFALITGPFSTSPGEVFLALLGRHPDLQLSTLVQEIRLPRVLGTILIGAALACAGTSFQALFRNPLVSPDILGVSSGAALGAVAAMALGASPGVVQLSAFLGGLTAVSLVVGLSALLKLQSHITLLLAGVVMAALFSAVVSLIQVVADSQTTLPGIVFWLLGSLSNLSHRDVLFLACAYASGFALIYSQHRALDKLALGETTAYSLGVNLQRTRWLCIVGATIMTATTVAVAGIIGWIGLVVPHLVRWWIGPNVKTNLIVGSLMSAAMLCFIDTLARSLFSIEIPIGIATAVIGVPLFLITLIGAKADRG